MQIVRIAVLVLVLAFLGMPVLARQETGPVPVDQREKGDLAPDPPQAGPPTDAQREEVRKKIEAIRIWRLTEALDLDANTSAQLSSLFASLDNKRQEIQRDQANVLRELKISLQSSKPEEAKLKTLLERLEKNRRAMYDLRDQEAESIKKILSVEQQARLVLFQQRFQREMRNMLRGAQGYGPMRNGAGRRGRGSASGPPTE